MEQEAGKIFLNSSVERIGKMSGHIEACLSRLTDEQIWSRGGAHENSIGNLILHLCGNGRQWIIAGVGGEKDVRDRDAEFATKGGWAREQLITHLRETTGEMTRVIESVKPERLTEKVTPQGRTVSVLEAIYQVAGHFQQHTGQIIFAAKILSGQDLGLERPRK